MYFLYGVSCRLNLHGNDCCDESLRVSLLRENLRLMNVAFISPLSYFLFIGLLYCDRRFIKVYIMRSEWCSAMRALVASADNIDISTIFAGILF